MQRTNHFHETGAIMSFRTAHPTWKTSLPASTTESSSFPTYIRVQASKQKKAISPPYRRTDRIHAHTNIDFKKTYRLNWKALSSPMRLLLGISHDILSEIQHMPIEFLDLLRGNHDGWSYIFHRGLSCDPFVRCMKCWGYWAYILDQVMGWDHHMRL